MVQLSVVITRIVDKLVSKSYIAKMVCPTNRRKMDITIREMGQNLIKNISKL
jgi:MarR family 2-MHQ and catechol resistance regulon transcriptional repressor